MIARLAVIGAIIAAPATLAGAQQPAVSLRVLHHFEGGGLVRPYAPLIRATDGNFYGTTHDGGTADFGTVFRMTPGGAITVLHSFTGGSNDGALPFAPLMQASNGLLYGTTYGGGALCQAPHIDDVPTPDEGRCGTVYTLTLGGVFTLLHAFDYVTEGGRPYAGLIEATDGNLYGTTVEGGAAGGGNSQYGTAFRMTPAGAVTKLYVFDNAPLPGHSKSVGTNPYAGLVQGADGNFYGVTSRFGAIFKMTPDGVMTPLHIFNSTTDGDTPRGSLVQGIDGSFYGTTTTGGTGAGAGSIFKITAEGAFALLHAFGGGALDGAFPNLGALVQAPDGNFYGTTTAGGAANRGTVFQVTAAGAFTLLHSFAGATADGAAPQAGLLRTADGNFWGTTSSGGQHNAGTAFMMNPAGAVSIVSLTGGIDGVRPHAGFIRATDGHFYGTTSAGGTSGLGTIIKMTSAGVVTVIHSFAGGPADGATPENGVIQANDGNFYGTTSAGGAFGAGAVYRMEPTGAVSLLHSFDSLAPIGVVQASDGALYGTTSQTVFKLTLAGTFELLHTLDSAPVVRSGNLLQANDGNLYGTTRSGSQGNAFGTGTIFRISTSGAFSVLHVFSSSGTEGTSANNGLIQGRDGFLYGTSRRGGQYGDSSNGYGVVFKQALDAPHVNLGYTVLHRFQPAPAAGRPFAGVLQAADGHFYGTTSTGGASGSGGVFRVTPDGSATLLHSFTGSGGAIPHAALVEAADGSFYGTTSEGGAFGVGVVFRVSAPFSDDPLAAGATARVAHITELRARIDALRVGVGLAPYTYSDSVLVAGTTVIKAQHIIDLRTALSQAYTAAGVTPPSYTDSAIAPGVPIKTVHVAELRMAVAARE
jgi:uncharacterized repeat protein (TIGR03803 family)